MLQSFSHSAVDCVIEVLLYDFTSDLPWSILIFKKLAVVFFFFFLENLHLDSFSSYRDLVNIHFYFLLDFLSPIACC